MNTDNCNYPNPELETAIAAFELQKIVARQSTFLHLIPQMITDFIAEIYERNPRAEVLHRWHIKLADLVQD